MKNKLVLLSFIFLFFAAAKTAVATEGIVELRSTTGENYRCFAASVLMQDGQYRIPITCRDLIYPIEGTITAYVLWADPVENDNYIKLGRLEFGKKTFNTRTAFSNLFVTTERNPDTRTPSGRIVMQGSVQPIAFLDGPSTATPTPIRIDEDTQVDQDSDSIIQEVEQSSDELTTREKLVLGLKRAGIVAFFALIALIGLIFVITRSRG